jgi:hypothetical protein
VTSAATVFWIDTGYLGTLQVNSQMFDDLENAGRVGMRSTIRFAGLGGTRSSFQGRLDTLTLGRFTHRDLVLDRHSRKNVFGLLYLKRFVVTFDFPKQVMYLKPSKAFDQIDTWDLSGLHIWRVKGEAIIDSVDPGSPAESLGLLPNDVIVRVNDQPAAEVSLTNLRAMLRDSTRTVALTIRRGEEMKSVALRPQEFRMKPGAPVESPQSATGR